MKLLNYKLYSCDQIMKKINLHPANHQPPVNTVNIHVNQQPVSRFQNKHLNKFPTFEATSQNLL